MKHLLLILIFITIYCLPSQSQIQRLWTLEECISYADTNSITLQQSQLQTNTRAVSLNTAQYSRVPNLNASMGSNLYFGRGPTRDGTYKDNTQLSGSIGLSTGMPLFTGLRIPNEIAAAKYDLKASLYDFETAKNNLSIQITTLYLQVLLSKEMVEVSQYQLELSRRQATRSKQLYESGKSPESIIYNSQATVASDELSLTRSLNTLQMAILDLSQAMNRESAQGFDIATPYYDTITPYAIENLEDSYSYALGTYPTIKAEETRLQSSRKHVMIAKSGLMPSLSLSAGYGTSMYRSYAQDAAAISFWKQFRNNANESIGLALSIPLFNRRSVLNGIKIAKISLSSQLLRLDNVKQNLRKEIEQCYYNAHTSYKQYMSASKALEASRVAFTNEEEKMAAGRSTIFDFNDSKSRLLQAESTLVQAKFEFIFRSKLLKFYSGENFNFDKYQ